MVVGRRVEVSRVVSVFYLNRGTLALRPDVPLVGYARVSTREQHLDSQTDALYAAGCTKLYVEHASGVLTRRPVLDDVLDYLREGDTLVVTKLDRLGRSVRNLKQIAATCNGATRTGARALLSRSPTRTRRRPHRLSGLAFWPPAAAEGWCGI